MKKGWSQGDLANELGVTRQYVSRIETGLTAPGRVLAKVILILTKRWGEPIEITDWWVE
jgi:transcriptional regulator with XRE-family HTH domain